MFSNGTKITILMDENIDFKGAIDENENVTKNKKNFKCRIYFQCNLGNAAKCSLKSCTELNVFEITNSVVVFSVFLYGNFCFNCFSRLLRVSLVIQIRYRRTVKLF